MAIRGCRIVRCSGSIARAWDLEYDDRDIVEGEAFNPDCELGSVAIETGQDNYERKLPRLEARGRGREMVVESKFFTIAGVPVGMRDSDLISRARLQGQA